jgi:hypothetical protein
VTSPRSRLAELFLAPRDADRRPPPRARRAADGSTLRRVAAAFVDEPASPVADAPGTIRSAGAIAVLARPADAAAAGGAVALAATSGCAVVLLWGAAASPVRAPSMPAARRVARRLGDRGHEAGATGRLVVVSLSGGPDEAVRVAAAAAVPAIFVIAGPRDGRVDAVLRGQDRAIAVGDGRIAELAAQNVAGLGVPATTLTLPVAPAARALAGAGVALVAPLRAPVEAALR